MVMYLLLAMFPVIITPIVNSAYESSINKNDRAKKTFLLCCGVLLFIMIAFRSQYVGAEDSQLYITNWNLLKDMPYSRLPSYLVNNEMEAGYLFTVWLLSHITPNAQMLFVYSGMLFTIAVCRFIYKNSDDACMSMVMFVCLGLYTFMVQCLRQAIAMCICLFAIEFFKNKKYVRFIVIVLLATIFHKTAIVFLAVFFIRFLKMQWKYFALVGAFSAAVLAASSYIVSYSKVLFDEESYTDVAQSGGFVATAIYILILLFALVFLTKKQKQDRDFIFFFYITYMGFFTYILRYVELVILERVSYYFLFGQMILLPKALMRFNDRVKNLVEGIVMVLCIVLLAYRLSSSDLIPYLFFWQK